MACSHRCHQFSISPPFRFSSITALPKTLKFTAPPLPPTPTRSYVVSASTFVSDGAATASVSTSTSFTWDDVNRASQSQNDDVSDLNGFFHKVKLCNRNSEKHSEFIPFVIEDQTVGFVHKVFSNHLTKFKDVFIFPKEDSFHTQFGSYVTLHPILRNPGDRTQALGDVIKCLGEEHIPGIRNEHYPATSAFGSRVFFSIERAAAPYFGIKSYGVHMNGYIERDGQKYLWLGKRSEVKPTYPGRLDHLVAGGMPHGISCQDNLVKECEEEAGIPSSISNKAMPVGAISYIDIEGYKYNRTVLFCYDLELPEDFIPENQDGEVESFKLIPVTSVANVVRRTEFFKTNCNLVIIDFLFRHGYIRPEDFGYLNLLQSLRSGDCS